MNSLKNKIAVIGAAGKMGKGISLLLLQKLSIELLYLIDTEENALYCLISYFDAELKRYAEKNINAMREKYPYLVSNQEVIEAFVKESLQKLRLSTHIEDVKIVDFVFEAAIEEEEVKQCIFSKLREQTPSSTLFFTNTSSIPIAPLAEKTKLIGRLGGFHFYNPPPIQPLVELIVPKEMREISLNFVKELGKKAVFSADIAGFIGNGQFIREIGVACELVQEEALKRPLHEAIDYIDRITYEKLLRPMGIFQLVDYVGIDVCDRIASIMSKYLKESFHQKLLKDFLFKGHLGGKKEGFFLYEKGEVVSVYDLLLNTYHPVEKRKAPSFSWKDLEAKKKVIPYLEELYHDTSSEGTIARRFLEASRFISNQLVKDQVAASLEDVHAIQEMGFHQILC